MSLSAEASSFDPYALSMAQPVRQGFYESNMWYEANVPSCAITSVRFDPYEEVLWTGTSDVCFRFYNIFTSWQGRVVSYLMPDCTKYTSWFAHAQHYAEEDCSVSEILVNSEGVVSLSCSGIKYSTRGGRTKSSYMYE